MKFKRKQKQSIAMNITPLIDIVFILLIFFAVTTSFITTSSIKVDLPKAKGEASEERKNIRLGVDAEGFIFVDGIKVEQDKLLETLQKLKQEVPEATVIIDADEKSMHGKVIFVMDKAKAADFTRFAISVESMSIEE